MVDILTAELNGICPVCEGYGGAREDPEECQLDEHHPLHSCQLCWCEGCHDGLEKRIFSDGSVDYVAMFLTGIDAEAACGSYAAFERVWGPMPARVRSADLG